jgi:hypothetical protein
MCYVAGATFKEACSNPNTCAVPHYYTKLTWSYKFGSFDISIVTRFVIDDIDSVTGHKNSVIDDDIFLFQSPLPFIVVFVSHEFVLSESLFILKDEAISIFVGIME